MNLYEQPRPLLQQLGQESFANPKGNLQYKKQRSTLLKYGGVQVNSTQQIR